MMTRREFLKMLGLLGLASQLPPPVFERWAEAEPDAPVKALVTVNSLTVEAESISITQSVGHDLYLWDEIYRAYSPPDYEVEVTTKAPLAVEFDTVYAVTVQLPEDDFHLEMEGYLKDKFADAWVFPEDRNPAGFGSYRYAFRAVKPPAVTVTEEAGLEWL